MLDDLDKEPPLARDYVQVPPEHLAELETRRKAIVFALNRRRRPGLSETVQQRLCGFDDGKIRRALFHLPKTLYFRADEMLSRHPVKAAQLHEIALALDLLLHDPMRRGALAAIDVRRHVRRSHEGRAAGLFILGRETKNGIPVDLCFDEGLAERFDRHLKAFRGYLRGAPAHSCFPSPAGGSRNPANLVKRLKQTVETALGVPFNVHLLRHLAATMIFEADPRNAPLAQRLLRHTRITETERMYGERRSRSAQAQWAAIIAQELGSHVPT